MSEVFKVVHDLENSGDIRHSIVNITRIEDRTIYIIDAFRYGDRTMHVPSAVRMYTRTGDSAHWTHSEEYRNELPQDVVEEIDRQIPLMYLMLS